MSQSLIIFLLLFRQNEDRNMGEFTDAEMMVVESIVAMTRKTISREAYFLVLFSPRTSPSVLVQKSNTMPRIGS